MNFVGCIRELVPKLVVGVNIAVQLCIICCLHDNIPSIKHANEIPVALRPRLK